METGLFAPRDNLPDGVLQERAQGEFQYESSPQRTLGDRPLSPETLMIGYGYDPALSEGSIKALIVQTSIFALVICNLR